MRYFQKDSIYFFVLWAIVIFLLASTHSYADKVVLNNEDVIEGVVTRQDRNSIVLEHSDLGRMEIPRSRIKTLTIDTPDVEDVIEEEETPPIEESDD